jgi:hypothetical protein
MNQNGRPIAILRSGHMQNNKTSSLIAYFLPRSQDIFFISILLAVAYYGPELFNLDGDLGRHITIGKYIITNKIIPTHDLFSYTMKGEELVPHEWLAQVLFSGAHSSMDSAAGASDKHRHH